MRFIKYVLLVYVLFTSVVNASYLRSVRIGSYTSEASAKQALVELNDFVQQQPDLVELQENYKFHFKQRASGKYYITLVEPLKQKSIAHEVLSIIKRKYPDAYIGSVTPPEMIQKTQLSQVQDLEQVQEKEHDNEEILPKKKESSQLKELHKQDEEVVQEEKEKKEEQVEQHLQKVLHKVLQEQLKEKQQESSKQEVEKVQKKEPEVYYTHVDQPQKQPEKIFIKEGNENFYKGLLLFAVVCLFVLLFFIVYYRRKVKHLEDMEFLHKEKYAQLEHNIQNKEKLISYVSHELRTPMTAIIGLVNLVLESHLSQLQKDYVQKIETSSTYMLSLLNDILDLSKMQAGKLKINHSEFNINDIISYVYNVVSIQAKHNNINIQVEVDRNVPSHIIGDSLRLGQILINLLANAVKFTKNGDVSLHVRKMEDYADNIVLEFVVSDTGIGMTQEQVTKLFNSFYQADDSIAQEYGGTGLGLVISKELVKMMNGEIRVKSQKDIGTTFKFSLSFALKDAQNKRQYRLPTGKLLNKSVLVVDSQSKNAIPLVEAFGYFKYSIDTIVSFEKSDLDITKNQFDIVVINLQNLTEIAIDKLKYMKSQGDTKVVVLSDLHSSLSDAMLHNLVIDAYLKPPITIQSILDLIIEIFIPKQLIVPQKKQTLKEKLSQFRDKNILVVEDNELNYKVIAGILENTGIKVHYVKNGAQAVKLFQNGLRCDLVLMDINMPVMDGYEATQEIRKIKKLRHMPILALSADVSAEAIRKSFKSGMQGHVSKPIDVDEFYSKIIELFSLKNKKNLLKEPNKNDVLVISKGLGRCHNDENLYKNILKDFQKMYVNSASKLYELCKKNEFKKARHLAMDIKDVALNIGAYKLAESTASMEYEFEKGIKGQWGKEIQKFHTLLKELFIKIERYQKE